MKNIIKNAAKQAKTDGYKYVASVIKQVYTTYYYHVIFIDDVISNGWSGAPRHLNGYKLGCTYNQLPHSCIMRTTMINNYKKRLQK